MILGLSREIHIALSGRRRFILVLDDRKILTTIVNFLKSVSDPFARGQCHSIIASCLRLMVKVPAAANHLESEILIGPVIFASMLSMAAEIRKEPTEGRRNIYLETILDTIVDWLLPDFPY